MENDKTSWDIIRSIIKEECEKYDEKWLKRRRVLNTNVIVLVIMKIIVNEKAQGLSTVLHDFWNRCDTEGIKLMQSKSIAPSSFCEARQKMSEEVFRSINERMLENCPKNSLWQGLRIFGIDGSRINIPRELIEAGYPLYVSDKRHYPQGLLSCLYDVGHKIVFDFDFVSHMNERRCVEGHLSKIKEPSLVMFDRGYFSYLLLHQCIQKGVYALFRLQRGGVNSKVDAFINSKNTDEIIEYEPSTTVIHDLKKQGFILEKKPYKIRLIKFYIKDEMYIFGTTLLDQQKFPINDLKILYHERWKNEELYKISKVFLEVELFHSKTERGVKQEIYANILLINIARFIESIANNKLPPITETERQKLKEDDVYKLFNQRSLYNINFKNCLMTVSRFLEKLVLCAVEDIKDILAKLIDQISRVRQKIRPNRSYQRISHKPKRKWQFKGDCYS